MDNLTLDLGGVINHAIDEKMRGFDLEGQIKGMLEDVAKNTTKILEVKLIGSERSTKLPLVHNQFEMLLNIATIQGMNILLTGGAGLSKSTAVEQVALALQLELASVSFSNQTTKTDLLGFVDANGIYRKSSFVDAFQNGKVFLGDEIDACSSNVLVLLNSAISNGFIETPDTKTIRVHDNFRFIATANTNLRGAKDGFTARNKLDAATIDRFVVIDWKLDKELESKIADNDAWVGLVRLCRMTAHNQLDGVVITPRSSYDGAKLLKAGIDIDTVIEMTIVKAMSEDERETLLKHITSSMKRACNTKTIPEPIPKVKYEDVTDASDRAEQGLPPKFDGDSDEENDRFGW